METDSNNWVKRLNTCKTESDILKFQTTLVEHLAELTGYHNDIFKRGEIITQCLKDRKEIGLAYYRDRNFIGIKGGSAGPKQSPFMENFNESLGAFLESI